MLRIILLATLLSGCASSWSKPNSSDQEFARDKYECQRDSRSATYSVPVPYPAGGHYSPYTADGRAMSNLGATITGVGLGLGVFSDCMVARGWTQVSE